jgi:hypothetical protein
MEDVLFHGNFSLIRFSAAQGLASAQDYEKRIKEQLPGKK